MVRFQSDDPDSADSAESREAPIQFHVHALPVHL